MKHQKISLAVILCSPFITVISASFLNSPLAAYCNPGLLTRATTKNLRPLAGTDTRKSTVLYESNSDSKSKIPKEFEDEIYLAESRTPAAQGRQSRILGFALSSVFFLALGVGNVAINTMEREGIDIADKGYAWTKSVFFLYNGFGGYMDIIAAGVLGTLVELEYKTRDDTIEKIWKEFERRKEKPKKSIRKQRKRSSKQSKRLKALAEVIVQDDTLANETVEQETESIDAKPTKVIKEKTSVVDKLKNLYAEADSMALAQAVNLNKELEDRGILDKIEKEPSKDGKTDSNLQQKKKDE